MWGSLADFLGYGLDFGVETIRFRKVPAHLPYSAVLEGRISFVDWMGNQLADAEARKGAEVHKSIAQAVQETNELRVRQRQLCLFYADLNDIVRRRGWSTAWFREPGKLHEMASSQKSEGASTTTEAPCPRPQGAFSQKSEEAALERVSGVLTLRPPP